MKSTVLIVDDEKSTRDGLRLALEDKYETFIAKDATEAARLMQDIKPDAVLTDLRMAGCAVQVMLHNLPHARAYPLLTTD